MPIDFGSSELTELVPKIAVIGVGGAGCNAVNNMIKADLQGVDFIVANTDAQSLSSAMTDNRLQLGVEITRGLGAGAKPNVGEAAAEESLDAIDDMLKGYHMAFITAGMGGGTGTGAAPVIARRARDLGVLTVGVVTKPFQFEGGRRMKLADEGITELADQVDTLIIIPNQNLFRVSNERTTFADAFNMADDVLHSGVRGVTDLMVMPGLINLDFADVRTVMSEMGKAMMGTGEAAGETRAAEAASAAIANPLLEESSLAGAKGVIINVTGGMDMTLFEVDEAVNMVREQVDPDALIVFGSAFNQDLEGRIRVSVVATGISNEGGMAAYRPESATPTPTPEPDQDNPDASASEPSDPETAESVSSDRGENPSDAQGLAAADPEPTPAQVDIVDMVEDQDSKPGHDVSFEASPSHPTEEDLALARLGAKPFVAEPAMHPKAQPTSFKPAKALPKEEVEPAKTATVHSHPALSKAADEKTEAPKKKSLFQMMTSGLKPSAEAETPQEASAPSQREAAPAEKAEEAEGTDKQADAGQLEIPSFLRRQQN